MAKCRYLQQGLLVVAWHIFMAINADDMPVLLGNVALLLFCLVLVILLSVNAPIPLDEVKGKVHQTAMTAMVLHSVTVHQLLFTQSDELVCNYGVDAFHCPNSGEGPARTTLQEKQTNHVNSIT